MAKIAADLIRDYHRRGASRTFELSKAVLDGLGTSLSKEISRKLSEDDLSGILECELEPGSYHSSADFRRDYLAVSLLSKYPFEGYRTKAQREEEAFKKFLQSEVAVRNTDLRLKMASTTRLNGVVASSYLHTMRRKIDSILGRFSWDSCSEFWGFGPGATTRLTRRQADAYYKFRGIPDVTYRCADLATILVGTIPLWHSSILESTGHPLHPVSFNWVKGNRITTVPKNAKTERVIAIEPDLNLWFQKGIGGVIRSRLRSRAGIDLNSQLLNQEMAKSGSITGKLATIDLASASDSVSMALVRELLPPDWTAAIEHCRSPKGVLPSGEEILYRKVSSMGNGFTFELETLIFWSALQAVFEFHPTQLTGRPHAVYGDDIVCPSDISEQVISLLEFIGFKCNMDKTFTSGPFRESCGKHYFRGEDVTPFYIREDINSVQRLFWFHNQYIRWLWRDHGSTPYLERDGVENRVIQMSRSYLPRKFLGYRIPYPTSDQDDLGDMGLFGTFDESRPKQLWFGSYRARCLTTAPRYYRPDDDGFLLRQLYSSRRMSASGWEVWGGGISTSEKVVRVNPTVFQWKDPYVLID